MIVEELIPWLYLKGVSTGDFSKAHSASQEAMALPGLQPDVHRGASKESRQEHSAALLCRGPVL
jgi:hypothetical protein